MKNSEHSQKCFSENKNSPNSICQGKDFPSVQTRVMNVIIIVTTVLDTFVCYVVDNILNTYINSFNPHDNFMR